MVTLIPCTTLKFVDLESFSHLPLKKMNFTLLSQDMASPSSLMDFTSSLMFSLHTKWFLTLTSKTLVFFIYQNIWGCIHKVRRPNKHSTTQPQLIVGVSINLATWGCIHSNLEEREILYLGPEATTQRSPPGPSGLNPASTIKSQLLLPRGLQRDRVSSLAPSVPSLLGRYLSKETKEPAAYFSYTTLYPFTFTESWKILPNYQRSSFTLLGETFPLSR